MVEAHHPYRPSAIIVGSEYPNCRCRRHAAPPVPRLRYLNRRCVPFYAPSAAAIAIRERQSRSPTSLMSPLLNSFSDRVLG